VILVKHLANHRVEHPPGRLPDYVIQVGFIRTGDQTGQVVWYTLTDIAFLVERIVLVFEQGLVVIPFISVINKLFIDL